MRQGNDELLCGMVGRRKCVIPFVPNAPFCYPLNTSENLMVF